MMNMGGPSTLEEVHPFLNRLFTDHQIMQLPVQSGEIFSAMYRDFRFSPKSTYISNSIGAVDREAQNSEDSKTVRRDWWRLSH